MSLFAPEISVDLAALRQILRSAVRSAGNANDVLLLARSYGYLNWMNNDGLLADDALEQEVHDRLSGNISVLASTPTMQAGDAVDWLHIVSEVYQVGGHTRLLLELLAGLAQGGASQKLLVTSSDYPGFANACLSIGVGSTVLKGDPVERCAAIVAAGRLARHTVLHIHPDDSAAALAARILQRDGVRTSLVNHADHVFSFGHGAVDTVLEISGFGWRTTQKRRHALRQRFLGIPISEPKVQRCATIERERDGPIVSIGSWGKYRPYGGLDFAAFADDLLTHVPNRMILIGPRQKDPWWADLLKRHVGRVEIMGPQPPEVVEQTLATAACYVDSFPTTGGTVFTQALMAGVPVFGPAAEEVGGYSLADALRASSIGQMTHAIESYLSGASLPADQDQIRARVSLDFSPEAVAHRLARQSDNADLLPPPSRLSLDFYADQWRAGGRILLQKREWRSLTKATRRALASRILSIEARRLSVITRLRMLRALSLRRQSR